MQLLKPGLPGWHRYAGIDMPTCRIWHEKKLFAMYVTVWHVFGLF